MDDYNTTYKVLEEASFALIDPCQEQDSQHATDYRGLKKRHKKKRVSLVHISHLSPITLLASNMIRS